MAWQKREAVHSSQDVGDMAETGILCCHRSEQAEADIRVQLGLFYVALAKLALNL